MSRKLNFKKIYLLFVMCLMFTSLGGAQDIDENNLISNSQFDLGTANWMFWIDQTSFNVLITSDFSLSGQNALKLGVGDASGTYPFVSALQDIELENNQKYEISFMASADSAIVVKAGIQQGQYPYTDYWKMEVTIDSAGTYGPFLFNSSIKDESAEFHFSIGGYENVTVLLDSVIIKKVDSVTDVVGSGSENAAIPNQFSLSQNYPNPFNPNTTIQFELAGASTVSLFIFSVTGKLIKTLVADQSMNAGLYRLMWDGKDMNNEPVSSGVYLYQLRTDLYQQTKEMIFLK